MVRDIPEIVWFEVVKLANIIAVFWVMACCSFVVRF
jgi:hypothetical protein